VELDQANDVYNVKDIIAEASDVDTKGVYVFVVWDGFSISKSSWEKYSDLNASSRLWWEGERSLRFPDVAYEVIRPTLHITSRPLPELIVDPTTDFGESRIADSRSSERDLGPVDSKQELSGSSSDSFDGKENNFEGEIVRERVVRGQVQFLVKWKGYPLSAATWTIQSEMNKHMLATWRERQNE
jgi:hypothetical protein